MTLRHVESKLTFGMRKELILFEASTGAWTLFTASSSTLSRFDLLFEFFNPLIHESDQYRISPYNINTISIHYQYNINTISTRQVMRIEKNINLGIIS